MESLLRDIKHGLGSLLRDKGFSATVMLTLAVGVAAYAATFAIVNSVLLRPLPGPNAGSIVLMSNEYPKAGAGDQSVSSAADYFDRLRAVTALEEQALFQQTDATVEIDGTPQRVPAMNVTPSFLRVVGISPAIGRNFTEQEGETLGDYRVILSDGLWHQLYGGDTSALGRVMRIGGLPFTIVGVMPKDFVFVYPEVRLWALAGFTAQEKAGYHNNSWANIGRLKPGATIAQVQAQVNALNASNLDRLPQFKDFVINAGFYTRVEPLKHVLVKDVESALYLLWGGAVFVLLIGGLNVTNLALARWSARSKEIATRLALGAGRAQIARQSIAESVVVAGAGGLAGVLLGRALLRLLGAVGLDQLPRADEVRVDGTVVLVSLGLAVLVGVLVGLVPLASAFKVNLSGVLRDSGRTGTSGAGTRRLRQGLVSAEIGLAFVLLAGAGLLLSSFRHLLAVDPGFKSHGVATGSVTPTEARYKNNTDLGNLMDRGLEAVRRSPGVVAAGATTAIPLGENLATCVILAEGYVMKPGESIIAPFRSSVTPGYFEAMNIGLVRGRYFDERDNQSGAPVVIVDEKLARHFWPNRDPIGQRMYQSDSPKEPTKPGAHTIWFQVVGVVRTVRLDDLAGSQDAFGAYYFPYALAPERYYTFAIRTAGEAGGGSSVLRTAMAHVDPDMAVFDMKTMDERAAHSMAPRRTSLMLAMAFGGLALFLSAVGIYGVLAYLVAQRRREIAIRMALGSTATSVVKLVLREGLSLVGIGLVIGFAGAAALQKAVASQIYGLRPSDPLVIGGVSLLLGAVALAACAAPAGWATRVDPIEVLRQE
jgi:predicted permease